MNFKYESRFTALNKPELRVWHKRVSISRVGT